MRFALLLCLAISGPTSAQVPPILLALRQQAWTVAEALAVSNPDPVVGKLVTFIRLLNSSQASAAELRRFMADNPGWPDQGSLERRYGEALADEPDEGQAAALCAVHPPQSGAALLRCAEASALSGDAARAQASARQGWTSLQAPPDQEADVLSRWGGTLKPADHALRFDRLEGTDQDAAERQLARLDEPTRRLDAARLAFRRREPDALSTLAAVPASLRDDPALLLAEARYLRRSGAESAALALWQTSLPAAEAATAPSARNPFWTERDALARALLAKHGDAEAYALADDSLLPSDQALDAHFLAGWVALRRLNDPSRARAHFRALAEHAGAAISRSRAFYWLARAQTDPDAIRTSLASAAAWPTTYYGQIAARAIGQADEDVQARITALRDPPVSEADRAALGGTELARAAAILVAWADPRRAADFVRQLAPPHATAADRAAVAQLALQLNLPEVAVQVARLAGREGVVLPQSGWPTPVQPPAGPISPVLVPPALALALMRQESSFDPGVVSAAGARGLMQLMPGTASQMARALHAPAGPLSDPDVNMRLGTAYLGTLLAQFGATQAYAIAAYNAGPRRVRDWLAANGDAAALDADSLVDWIELIPYAETRNYVQRVLESEMVYRARLRASFMSSGGHG